MMMGVRKCHCNHIRSHVWCPSTCPPSVQCCQQRDMRLEYIHFCDGSYCRHDEKVPCPLLTNQAACWHRRADPACRSSVLTWPSLAAEPEIDWHASMRATESLAIPFEQPAHSDWAIHRGKQRFMKPAYANCINRLNPSQVEMQGKGTDKETPKEERK